MSEKQTGIGLKGREGDIHIKNDDIENGYISMKGGYLDECAADEC
jgi:hypothetical protein